MAITEQFTNNAATTLNGGINNAVTSLIVTSASGFPASGNFRIIIDAEILLVTGVSGTTFTVSRGAEATTATSHGNGAAVTHVLTAASHVQAITDRLAGFSLMCTPPGIFLNDTSMSASANQGYLVPMPVSAPMYVDKLGFQVTAHNTGTVQWGLFDFSINPASATLLAGGSGTLTSNGYQTIAATSAPILIQAGYYAVIVLTASNPPQWTRTEMNSQAVPLSKFYNGTYSWSNTPDLTNANWTTDIFIQNVILHGRLSSGTAW